MKFTSIRKVAAIGSLGLAVSTPSSLSMAAEQFPGIFQNVDPTQGPVEQAVGFYSNGTLKNAMQLPLAGDGFVKLFPSRNRAWSTYDMQHILALAASRVKGELLGSERVQIGDMSNRAGGSIGMHASHQNGLDADVSYLRVNHREQSPSHNGFDEVFVTNGRLSDNFDIERNWQLLNWVVSTGRVQRIFVDQVIKRAFCDYAKAIGEFRSSTETLRALRIWPNHDDHFHVRLTCPKKSPGCVVQDPPPVGDGCSEAMNAMYWFSVRKFAPEPGIEE